MNPAADIASQIEETTNKIELLQLQEKLADMQQRQEAAERDKVTSPMIESPLKYGNIEIKDEDRKDIEEALPPEVLAQIQKQTVPVSNVRNEFVAPCLQRLGWSVRDWARKAGVDHKTANNYLKGKGVFPNTRKKLADALQVESLPD